MSFNNVDYKNATCIIDFSNFINQFTSNEITRNYIIRFKEQRRYNKFTNELVKTVSTREDKLRYLKIEYTEELLKHYEKWLIEFIFSNGIDKFRKLVFVTQIKWRSEIKSETSNIIDLELTPSEYFELLKIVIPSYANFIDNSQKTKDGIPYDIINIDKPTSATEYRKTKKETENQYIERLLGKIHTNYLNTGYNDETRILLSECDQINENIKEKLVIIHYNIMKRTELFKNLFKYDKNVEDVEKYNQFVLRRKHQHYMNMSELNHALLFNTYVTLTKHKIPFKMYYSGAVSDDYTIRLYAKYYLETKYIYCISNDFDMYEMLCDIPNSYVIYCTKLNEWKIVSVKDRVNQYVLAKDKTYSSLQFVKALKGSDTTETIFRKLYQRSQQCGEYKHTNKIIQFFKLGNDKNIKEFSVSNHIQKQKYKQQFNNYVANYFNKTSDGKYSIKTNGITDKITLAYLKLLQEGIRLACTEYKYDLIEVTLDNLLWYKDFREIRNINIQSGLITRSNTIYNYKDLDTTHDYDGKTKVELGDYYIVTECY